MIDLSQWFLYVRRFFRYLNRNVLELIFIVHTLVLHYNCCYIVWQSPGPTPLLFLRLQALPHMGWTLSSTPLDICLIPLQNKYLSNSDIIIRDCLSFTQTWICLSTSSSPKLCVDRPAISETSCTTDLAEKRAIWYCACDGVSEPLKFIHGWKF